jgi:hypothetical protein
LIGAALSSMSARRRPCAISTAWFASPTTVFSSAPGGAGSRGAHASPR